MSSVHSSSTRPEVKMRKELWRQGYRYRINVRQLPGSPDIVLPKYHTVIFVHGCFWHGHRGCRKYAVPKTNTKFWEDKIARNQKRDQDVWRQLEAQGWFVVIVWECELGKRGFESTIHRVVSEIAANGDAYRQFKEERTALRKRYQKERKEQIARHSNLMSEVARLK